MKRSMIVTGGVLSMAAVGALLWGQEPAAKAPRAAVQLGAEDTAAAQVGRNSSEPDSQDDQTAEAEIRRLYDLEHKNLLRMDVAAQERFLPDDFVVTNPFNMFIDKRQVVERLRGDVIKYSKYERQYDLFRRYGDTMVVIGSETVVPTPDANRADAGMTVNRRFTEMWVRRDGTWQKVVRHASNVTQPRAGVSETNSAAAINQAEAPRP